MVVIFLPLARETRRLPPLPSSFLLRHLLARSSVGRVAAPRGVPSRGQAHARQLAQKFQGSSVLAVVTGKWAVSTQVYTYKLGEMEYCHNRLLQSPCRGRWLLGTGQLGSWEVLPAVPAETACSQGISAHRLHHHEISQPPSP